MVDKSIDKLTLQEAYRRLSRRECEILDELIAKKTSQQIAQALFLSKSTVENHITSIGNALSLKGKGRLRRWLNSDIATADDRTILPK